MTPREKLVTMLADYPTARIVTDVGASMISGWGNLIGCIYYANTDTIELLFD